MNLRRPPPSGHSAPVLVPRVAIFRGFATYLTRLHRSHLTPYLDGTPHRIDTRAQRYTIASPSGPGTAVLPTPLSGYGNEQNRSPCYTRT